MLMSFTFCTSTVAARFEILPAEVKDLFASIERAIHGNKILIYGIGTVNQAIFTSEQDGVKFLEKANRQ